MLAEMLGLHIYADTLLELRSGEEIKEKYSGVICQFCFLHGKECGSSQAAVDCGPLDFSTEWKPKP